MKVTLLLFILVFTAGCSMTRAECRQLADDAEKAKAFCVLRNRDDADAKQKCLDYVDSGSAGIRLSCWLRPGSSDE